MMNGACYIRVSTDDQTEFSPDAQLKALKEYAKKNDIILSKKHIYIDEGISGKSAKKRPAFMEMIAIAKSKPKPFDVILVHKFDRFARSREDSVVYKSLLRKEADIKVISITEKIEDDKFSVILEAMLEAMAEYYSLNLSEEVKKGMTEKATRGGLQTNPPFGYKAENNKLVIDEKERDIVKLIFNKFANREMGLRTLALYINSLNIKTHRGNSFENRTVEYILNNPVYIGKLRWTPTEKVRRNYHHPDSIIANAEHTPIIDTELWEKTQEVLKETKELYTKKQRSTTKIKSWLNGLVRCSNCNCTLVATNKNYLQCNGYAKGACKISHHVKISILEETILEEIKQTFEGKLQINIVPKQSDVVSVNEYDLLNDNLKKLEIKEIRIKEAYQDGIDTLQEYKDNKTKIETDRKKTIEQLQNLKQSLQNPNAEESIIKKLESVYELLSNDEIDVDIKYKSAHLLINKIIFNKTEKTLLLEYK